jgi:hypothetical protein
MRERSNQGMRQPQYGGIQSQLRLARSTAICRHKEFWRLGPEHKWVCAVCHPPLAFADDAIERMTAA